MVRVEGFEVLRGGFVIFGIRIGEKSEERYEGIGLAEIVFLISNGLDQLELKFGMNSGELVGIFESADGANGIEGVSFAEDGESLSKFRGGCFDNEFVDGGKAFLALVEAMEGFDALPLGGAVLGLLIEDGLGGGKSCGGTPDVHPFEDFVAVLVAGVTKAAENECESESGEESA